MLGTFVSLIDTKHDQFHLISDQSIRSFQCTIDNQVYIAYLKFWPDSLMSYLTKLNRYYELIIFTILPREIVTQFSKSIAGFDEIISHSLCYEDLVFSSES